MSGSAEQDLGDEEMFTFQNMQEVYDYMRLNDIELDEKELRVIAAGISFRAAWAGISEFENLHRGLCPETKFVKLVPNQGPTLKSRLFDLLGMQVPFDRHDYIVDRCGSQHRYIVEFYQKSDFEFFVDARPAFNNGLGWFDRVVRRPLTSGWHQVLTAIGKPPVIPKPQILAEKASSSTSSGSSPQL